MHCEFLLDDPWYVVECERYDCASQTLTMSFKYGSAASLISPCRTFSSLMTRKRSEGEVDWEMSKMQALALVDSSTLSL